MLCFSHLNTDTRVMKLSVAIGIGDEIIEQVDEHQCSGRHITQGNEMGAEIDKRITIVWQIFDQYRHFQQDETVQTVLEKGLSAQYLYQP